MNRRIAVASLPFFLFILFQALCHAETDSARVARLFVYASSGEVRHRDLVQPGKDSIIAMGETGARWLACKLNATDARERLTLAEIFEKIGPVAVPYLTPYLDSAGEYMPKNAARCLGGIKDSSATWPLLPHLAHENYSVRSEVATALGKIADRRAARPLIDRLAGDTDSDVRKSCVVALGTIGDSGASVILIESLGDPFFGVRQSAIGAIGKLNPPPCAGLVAAAESADSLSRYGAIVALGYCPDILSRQLLVNLVKDSDPMLRGFAIEAMSRDTTAAVRETMAKLLESEQDPFVRAQIERVIRTSHGQ